MDMIFKVVELKQVGDEVEVTAVREDVDSSVPSGRFVFRTPFAQPYRLGDVLFVAVTH